MIQSDSRSAIVLYGSETGTAEDLAGELGRILERLRFRCEVGELNDVDWGDLSSYDIVCIVVSTTGQGDVPRNAQTAWKSLLRKRLSAQYLEDVNFAAFGLGDSSYPQFNWAIRKISRRFIQLGATEIFPCGEADELHEDGIEGTFAAWAGELRDRLLLLHPLPPHIQVIPAGTQLPAKRLLLDAESGHETATSFLVTDRDAVTRHTGIFLDVRVSSNTRITPTSHWQDVRQLTLQSDTHASYCPGDVITIFPENDASDVQRLLDLMHWSEVSERQVIYQSSTMPAVKSKPITLRRFLSQHVDFMAVPRRSFFNMLASYTNDEYQKQRLLEFGDPQNLDELYDYTTRPRRSILEVLQEFDTLNIPWNFAAEVFPKLKGRQFSIASGGNHKQDDGGKTRFELLVAVVKYRTVIRKIREGVCTKYVKNLEPGSEFRVELVPGSLGSSGLALARPLILIGPGTGVAPIRSLIWDRVQAAAAKPEQPVGQVVLFFGCRNEAADYFFKDEWEKIKQLIPLNTQIAFSRDQAEKVYVQDLVRQNGGLIVDLVCGKDGIIYVCGSSGKMPQAVRRALLDAFIEHGSMTETEAGTLLTQLEKKGQYKQETWS